MLWGLKKKKSCIILCHYTKYSYQILLAWGLWWNIVWFHLFHSSNEKELRENLDVSIISKSLEGKEAEL